MDRFCQILAFVAGKAGFRLTGEQLAQFSTYYQLLLDWNEKINLTAITGWEEVAEKHYIDSLLASKVVNLSCIGRMADIGTGAGFPGIPLKIVFPHLEVVLVDTLRKRVSFLAEVVTALNMAKVTILHTRAEDMGKNGNFREQFELVVSRAVARLPVLLELCLPLVQVGGLFLAYKGPEAGREAGEATRALVELGGEIAGSIELTLPVSGDRRNFVLVRKVKQTPVKFPRKAGLAVKKPL